jgi:Glycosyl hydrolase family 12
METDMTCRPRIVRVPVRMMLCLVVAAATVILPGVAASAAPLERTCKPWQALPVTAPDGQQYLVRNKPSTNDNDDGMCVAVAGSVGFTVTKSPGIPTSSTVRAYPYIGTGCFAGACAGTTAATGLPRAGELGDFTVSWATKTPKHSGVWNSSLDLWIGPHIGMGTTEMMIWLQYSKPSWWVKLYPRVRIDGANWYVVPHATLPGKFYISFRRASTAHSAKLRLAPFMRVAQRLGVLIPSQLLWSVQAGFEIWSGGRGLTVTRFTATQ